ncbi:hypothetical protein [Nostoc sp. CMAA1605]|nr:hypothetical protein [Nostoc sp. CMAA1605]
MSVSLLGISTRAWVIFPNSNPKVISAFTEISDTSEYKAETYDGDTVGLA